MEYITNKWVARNKRLKLILSRLLNTNIYENILQYNLLLPIFIIFF